MRLYKSRDPNIFHYVTAVTFRRVPVFRSEIACSFFVQALAETKEQCPFKLVGYVIMPDHVHLIINPLSHDISDLMGRLKGSSARRILNWLRSSNHAISLAKLALNIPQKRSHTHSVWLKDFSAIDLWSPKFIRQKLNYIHANPVRAGLCEHPAYWRWSSYHAYLPHESGSVPIEIDWQGYWDNERAGTARLQTDNRNH
jgi:putative transposase